VKDWKDCNKAERELDGQTGETKGKEKGTTVDRISERKGDVKGRK